MTATATAIATIDDTRREISRELPSPTLPTRIDTLADADALADTVADVEGRIRQAKARIAEPKKRAHQVWKDWIALENDLVGKAEQFCADARRLINDFARRERERAEAEARERARQEREAAEAKALADAQALEALAAETGEQVYAEMADAVIENVPDEVAPIKAAAPVVGGRKVAQRRVLTVTNLRMVLAQVVAGTLPIEVVAGLNMRALGDHVKTSGKLPAGCEWETADTVTIGKR